MRALLIAGCVALVATCARPYPPSGGEEDRLPPALVETTPAPLAVVAPTQDMVVFRFDEKLSERNFGETLIAVSPLDGALRVERSGEEVRVGIEGGWRADRIYRVTVLPGLRDLFGNERRDPVELVFSTGPPVPATAFAGLVLDRITGRAAVNPVVELVRRADTVRYAAFADSVGFFALRHIPLGVYEVRAWGDANRNRRRDALEPIDSGAVISLGATSDTLTRTFRVLTADTTGPELSSVNVVDSLHVRVQLDDHVEADGIAAATLRILTVADSALFTTSTAVDLESVFNERRNARRDTAAPAEPEPRTPVDVLPSRTLVFRLARPLLPGTEYIAQVAGVANLFGRVGGGAETFETAAVRPPPPGAPPSDTLRVPQRRQ